MISFSAWGTSHKPKGKGIAGGESHGDAETREIIVQHDESHKESLRRSPSRSPHGDAIIKPGFQSDKPAESIKPARRAARTIVNLIKKK